LVVLCAVGGSPAALASDAVHYLGLRTIEVVGRLLGGCADKAVHVEAGRESCGILAGPSGGLPIEFEEWREPCRLAADDGQCQRQAECAGAGHRLRRAADGDPDRKSFAERPRMDAAFVDLLRVASAGPGYRLALVEFEQQCQ